MDIAYRHGRVEVVRALVAAGAGKHDLPVSPRGGGAMPVDNMWLEEGRTAGRK